MRGNRPIMVTDDDYREVFVERYVKPVMQVLRCIRSEERRLAGCPQMMARMTMRSGNGQ